MSEDGTNGGSTPHENDADSRPRVYLHTVTDNRRIEVTVQGAEGESTETVSEHAKEQFDHVMENESTVEDDKQVGFE